MECKNGMKYRNVYERAASLYESTCAPCGNAAGHASVWKLMMQFYEVFEKKAELLGLAVTEDAPFSRWEQQKGRENDVKKLRSAMDKIMEFEDMLLSFVVASYRNERGLFVSKDAIKLKKLFFLVLEQAAVEYEKGAEIGILLDKECAIGLQELATHAINHAKDTDGTIHRDRALTYFSRIVFDDNKDWLVEHFDVFLNAGGELKILCAELEARGFYRSVYIDGRRLTLNYLKNYVKNPGPLKMSFGERTRLGIEIAIEDYRETPAILSLRIPFYTEVLKEVSDFSEKDRSFAMSHTKTCDGCRCCVRTDKSNTRPLAAITIEAEKKCPMYPSFSYSFVELDEKLRIQILSIMDAFMQTNTYKTNLEKM